MDYKNEGYSDNQLDISTQRGNNIVEVISAHITLRNHNAIQEYSPQNTYVKGWSLFHFIPNLTKTLHGFLMSIHWIKPLICLLQEHQQKTSPSYEALLFDEYFAIYKHFGLAS